MSKLHDEWMRFNESQEREGKESIPFEKWFNEKRDTRVSDSISYLGLDVQAPNHGTRNKQKLMTEIIHLTAEWKQGQYDQWINLVSIRLGLQRRTAKNNYIDPLIGVGILVQRGKYVVFNGPPEVSNAP